MMIHEAKPSKRDAVTHFDEVFDFVIVGSGGGSMCAALVIKSAGKEPLILEKSDLVGGSTAMSGGVMWIPDNAYNRMAGIEDSKQKGLEYINGLIGDAEQDRGTSPARRAAYVENAPKMLDLLRAHGLKFDRSPGFSDYYDERPGGVREGRVVGAKVFDVNELPAPWRSKLRLTGNKMPLRLDLLVKLQLIKRTWFSRAIAVKLATRMALGKLAGRNLVGCGAALQGRMLQAALKLGIDLRVESPVTSLIVETGKVTGVTTTRNGAPWRVAARMGVLINSGGFARNQRMRDLYIPGSSVEWTKANPGDTGEMIEEVLRIGGSADMMNEGWWQSISIRPDGMVATLTGDISKPYSFMVDSSARRFCNEAASYMEVGQAQFASRNGVQALPAWLIMDSRNRSYYPLHIMPPGTPSSAHIKSGFIKSSGTIEGLAEQCGLDPVALQATQQRFNRFARAGVDEDFHRGARAYDNFYADPTNKPVPTLGEVSKPPFYAVRIIPGDVGTAGGIVADELGRALTADGAVIPGLYVTGNASAPVMGRYYAGAGTSIGASFTFGYIAARHALSVVTP
jgi:3-oxosteroid 1-dehydrogenase